MLTTGINSDGLSPISLQPNVVDLRYFKPWIIRWFNLSLKYQRFTTSGGKDIGIKIFDFEDSIPLTTFRSNFKDIKLLQLIQINYYNLSK